MAFKSSMELTLKLESDEQLFNFSLSLIVLFMDLKTDGYLICDQIKLDGMVTEILSRGIRNTEKDKLVKFCYEALDFIKHNDKRTVNFKKKTSDYHLSHEELDFINVVFSD
nr:hypothetical protein [uncultured Tolumonas sp.]